MKCACAILSSVVCPAVQNFSTLSHKRHDFRWGGGGVEGSYWTFYDCFDFLYKFVWNISHSKKKWARYEQDSTVYWPSCKVPTSLVTFKWNINFQKILIVVLPCILISSKILCQQRHSLLKHKMLQLTLKISLYMAPTCFGPFGPSSGNTRRNFAKVTVFVELLLKVHR
jgi:hypothetical protein